MENKKRVSSTMYVLLAFAALSFIACLIGILSLKSIGDISSEIEMTQESAIKELYTKMDENFTSALADSQKKD